VLRAIREWTRGFGLENFNAIGAWRTEEGNFPWMLRLRPMAVLPHAEAGGYPQG
jgi:hypothetical protein